MTDLEQSRAEFEKHLTLLYGARVVKRYGDSYVFDSTNHEWVIWQAALTTRDTALEAENARLREALEQISEQRPLVTHRMADIITGMHEGEPIYTAGPVTGYSYHPSRDIALAALTLKGTER